MSSSVAARAKARLADLNELERLRLAIAGAEQAVYDWVLADDSLVWTAPQDLPRPLARLADCTSGGAFVESLPPHARAERAGMIEAAVESGSYCAEYQIRAGRHPDWVEEQGICLVDDTGAPVRLVGSLRLITERKRREADLINGASFDELTGHLNRAQLKERLDAALARANEMKRQSAYLVAAIDDLAVINETYGFNIADEVIISTGRILSGLLKAGDSIGRTSGNKFGIVLAQCDAATMDARAGAFLQAMREATLETRGGRVAATISIGGVLLPQSAPTCNAAMIRAEEALTVAKTRSRSAYHAFTLRPNWESTRKRNLLIVDQIIAALADNRVRLAFQPIVSAETGETRFHESLVRLMGRDGTPMPAGEFIPIAEQMGLIRLIDHRVLELALATLASEPDLNLSLNVSRLSSADPSWLEKLRQGVAGNGSLARRLIVELTETQAIHDLEETRTFVSEVRALGCQVAIDDFGAGYTSFRNLKALDVNLLKIDGSFIKGLAESKENRLFVRTLVDLARNLDLDCVAEWVSNDEEAAILRTLGVKYLQGFGIAEPTLDPPWARPQPQEQARAF